MMHQGQKFLAVFLDKRKPEAAHVVKVSVEGCRRNTGKFGNFPEAKRIETPARSQFGGGRIHEFLPGFCFLLLSGDL
jgi:hypothetical protein